MYKLLEQRQIPYILLGQKRKVIRREHLEAWLQRQTVLPKL